MNLEPENRRSFVKKSLATSMTLTFAGLIRAHGDGGTGGTTIDPENTYVTTNSGATTTFDLEGTYYTTIGNTTTFDLEETYETTTYQETTTWDPEETTILTTNDLPVSIKKIEPGGSDLTDPGKRTRFIDDFAGFVRIFLNDGIIYQAPLKWKIIFEEYISFIENPIFTSVDCVDYLFTSEVYIEVDVQNVIAPLLSAPAKNDLLIEITNGINLALDRIGPAKGPTLHSAYPVMAGRGNDQYNNVNPGPVVVVDQRVGSNSTSSHGYWVRVLSNVGPNPSKQVAFMWNPQIRRSQHINIEKHIKLKILESIIPLAQQLHAHAPLAEMTVQCEIDPLPDVEDVQPMDQVVIAYDTPPVALGLSCMFLNITDESCEPPTEELEPEDGNWNRPDPSYPQLIYPSYVV